MTTPHDAVTGVRLESRSGGSSTRWNAGCLCDRAECVSYADLFATHPAFRACGLAQILMSIIVQRLQTKGYRIAKLSTDSDNHAMQRVAQITGFQVTGITLHFQRPVQRLLDH
ncbi:MAG: hypothetical protein GFH27_549283n26 [Chloroflexi bacterium AL-W]|nr:hypothetical protein [Chloroflexi bacterium AL-N1]NOK64854.1 hypothetical protein [Chloroflexi bacterium AL-N10]NOK76624.1 hypothetical protein [Chloroflexi bacterium AL-N5]NOK80147.1 hypothetical protein [Chloroflexi bacterium AL-W]NOK86660.1 hypothetical protein [Chloroflexi bacterium AL-N15]